MYGGMEVWLYTLTPALDEGEWSTSCPSNFAPGERAPGTHWTGNWVAPQSVWMWWGRGTIPASARNQNLSHPAHSPMIIPTDLLWLRKLKRGENVWSEFLVIKHKYN